MYQEKPNHVWTELDADGVMIIGDGYHHVNRFAYYITEVPADPNKTYEVYDEDDREFNVEEDTISGNSQTPETIIYNALSDYVENWAQADGPAINVAWQSVRNGTASSDDMTTLFNALSGYVQDSISGSDYDGERDSLDQAWAQFRKQHAS